MGLKMKEFKQNGCTLSMIERCQNVSELWKTIPPDEKKSIEDAAEVDKARYARELTEYNQVE